MPSLTPNKKELEENENNKDGSPSAILPAPPDYITRRKKKCVDTIFVGFLIIIQGESICAVLFFISPLF